MNPQPPSGAAMVPGKMRLKGAKLWQSFTREDSSHTSSSIDQSPSTSINSPSSSLDASSHFKTPTHKRSSTPQTTPPLTSFQTHNTSPSTPLVHNSDKPPLSNHTFTNIQNDSSNGSNPKLPPPSKPPTKRSTPKTKKSPTEKKKKTEKPKKPKKTTTKTERTKTERTRKKRTDTKKKPTTATTGRSPLDPSFSPSFPAYIFPPPVAGGTDQRLRGPVPLIAQGTPGAFFPHPQIIIPSQQPQRFIQSSQNSHVSTAYAGTFVPNMAMRQVPMPPHPLQNTHQPPPPATPTSPRRKRKFADVEPNLHCEICVSNISQKLCENEKALLDMFSVFGQIISIRIPTIALPFETSKPKYKGIAFIRYSTLFAANKAINHYKKTLDSPKFDIQPSILPEFPKEKRKRKNNSEPVAHGTELYIMNMPMRLLKSKNELEKIWKQFGPITRCAIPLNHYGEPVGYMFVRYSNSEDAKRAKQLDGTNQGGRRISVQFAEKKLNSLSVFTGTTDWIFVTGLPSYMREPDLRRIFEVFGDVEEVDDSSVQHKSHAFIRFRYCESVKAALSYQKDEIYVVERLHVPAQIAPDLSLMQYYNTKHPIPTEEVIPKFFLDQLYNPDSKRIFTGEAHQRHIHS